jgi:hypothetical protein
LLVSCLQRDSIRQVLDVLERPDQTTPYTCLKERLMVSHELMDFQRIEKLFQMDQLGGRKPSELMNQMLEICPRGEEKNKFFLFLFLQQLPRELRVMLAEENINKPRDLAAKADCHWAMLNHQTHGLVAPITAADSEEPMIVAVQHAGLGRGRGRGGGGRGRGRGGYQQQQQQDGQSAYTPPHPTALGTLAIFSTGLCHFHWSFGEKAKK